MKMGMAHPQFVDCQNLDMHLMMGVRAGVERTSVVSRGPRLSTDAHGTRQSVTSADVCDGTQSISCSPCCKLALMEDNRLQVPLPAWAGWQVGASKNVAKLSLPLPDTECRVRAARIVSRYLFLAVNHEDWQRNDDRTDSSVWSCVGGGCPYAFTFGVNWSDRGTCDGCRSST